MATIRGIRIDDHSLYYWIFFEQGEIQKPLLILNHDVLKDILRHEGFDLVKRQDTGDDLLTKIEKVGMVGIFPPDRIEFTVSRLDSNQFKLTYKEHFDNLPPEIEEKFDSAVKATIALIEQQPGVKVKKIKHGLAFESPPLPIESVVTGIVAEICSMAHGVYSVEKLDEAVRTIQKIFDIPLPDKPEE